MRRAVFPLLLCALPFAAAFQPPDELNAPPGPPPAATPAGECGLGAVTVPDFTLQDLCPGSPTYEQQVTLSDHLGEVMVIYWATAT